MNRRSVMLLLTALLSAAVPAAAVQTKNLHVGTWTLDPAASKGGSQPATAASLVIADLGEGRVRVQVHETLEGRPESTWSFEFGAIGRESPVVGVPDIDSVLTTATGERTSSGVFKKAGQIITEVQTEVSEDGRQLTVTSKARRPDGTSGTTTSVYRRQPS
jgi:hypothetical protein